MMMAFNRIKKAVLVTVLPLLLLTGCGRDPSGATQTRHVSTAVAEREIPLRYARYFSMKKVGNATLIEIRRPEGAMRGVFYRYLLVPKGEEAPPGYPDALVVPMPVERVTCGLGLQVSLIERLGEIESIRGIGRGEWTGNRDIRRKMATGEVIETGMSADMNMEVMVSIDPDIAFIYASGSDTDAHQKLLPMGIKPGLVCMHLEPHPLGVLEWIRFYAAFYGKEGQAEAYFTRVADRYEKLAASVKNSFKERPTVIVGHGTRGIWTTHGSSAWFVRLLHDAGGRYILEKSGEYEENPVSLEHALKVGLEAEYWVNPRYTARSIADLLGDDERYRYFASVRSGNVFNNDKLTFDDGRTLFWEIGMTEPDVVLSDLVSIFHPDLLPDHRMKYYRRFPK
ncbi:MAG: ABC transporter substrate-binding protein [Chlorobiaceae bacterium]|nr:ABC transporter substrate-binding protein [Chlorobiaceae bacterium]